ncbi:MAG: hypothetical protein OXQ29_15165 [Rhodospirillaceae bacterium]|nr:hypothetical protein [Rhodospirillaceae bacterium]
MMVEQLQAQINGLRAQLGLDPADDLSTSIADLQDDLAALQKQVDDAADEAAKMAAAAAAKDAMMLFDGIGDATNLTVAVTTVNDTHGGGMASVTATGLTPGVGANAALMKSAEPMLGMWQGTMLTRAVPDDATTNPGTSSTVVVYTDIAAPKAVPFGDVHSLTGDVLTLDADADADAHVALISASAFMHTGRMNHDPDPDAADDVARIRGMFNGASGEYRCTAATPTSCASIESSAGVRLAGTWVFDPDSGAMAMMADPSYAYFGWWLNKGTTEGVEAGVFHSVTDGTGDAELLAAPADISALGGTATYSGSAAGKYAIQPGLSAASGGHWTADATLTADFGNETAAGTISGMVDGFMAGGEMMDWSVALGETALTGTGTFDSATGDPATGDGVVWTIGGVDGAEAGAWSGGLRAAGDNGVPTLATGMFSATHGSVGHMLGAFGAHLDE